MKRRSFRHTAPLSVLFPLMALVLCGGSSASAAQMRSSIASGERVVVYLFGSPFGGSKVVNTYSLHHGAKTERVVVILVNALRLADALSSEMPFLSGRLSECPIGLMSSDCRRRGNEGSVYVTMALGCRSAGDEMASCAFNLNERVNGESAADAYRRIYGKAPKGEIVHLGWKHIAQLNGADTLCGLGWALRVGGVTAAFIGGRNFFTEPSDYGVCLLTDEDGCVRHGIIDDELCRLTSLKGLFIPLTDERKLKELVGKAIMGHRFVAVEIDDALCAVEAPPHARRLALNHIDKVMRMLVELCDANGAFAWLVAPLPPTALKREMALVAALGQPDNGLLTSKTTHLLGIVSATDLAVTWLYQLGLKAPSHMTGHAIRFVKVDDAHRALLKLSERVTRHFKSYVGAVIGVVTLCILTLIVIGMNAALRFSNPLHLQVLKLTALMSFSTPMSLFIAGAFEFQGPVHAMMFVIAASILFGALGAAVGAIRGANIISAAMFTLVVIDCAFGNGLLRNSFITYTPINGWRFYGLGNEAVGALIPFSALTLSWLLALRAARAYRLAIALIFSLSAITAVGAPTLGANFGGAVSIGMTLIGLSASRMWRNGNWMLTLCAIVASMLFVPLIVSVLELAMGKGVTTHIGELLMQVRLNGLRALHDAAVRRMLVHAEVIQGQRLYLISIVTLLALTAALPRLGMLLKFNLAAASWDAILFSCVGLWGMLIFNDTGALAIVPGLVVTISYTFLALASLTLSLRHRSSAPTAVTFNGG
ncbi:MAG: hypothetical protein GDYSWBUE_000605 [Candidatus Fervidibacterota bacterium]